MNNHEIWMFYSDTCAPCRLLKPVIEEVSRVTGVPLRMINATAESNKDIVAAHHVRSVPVTLVKSGDTTVFSFVGAGLVKKDLYDLLLDQE
jgi:thiol-disulfide isomerase/thioredoxin